MNTRMRTVWPASRFSGDAGPRARYRCGVTDLGAQHHAGFDAVAAGEEARSRACTSVEWLHLGEVAQQADVDADDGHGRAVEQVHTAQHRAIAAEAEHDLGRFGLAAVGGRLEPQRVGVAGIEENGWWPRTPRACRVGGGRAGQASGRRSGGRR